LKIVNRSIAFHEGEVIVLLASQAVLVAVAVGAFLFLAGLPHAQAAAYGGGIALLSAWLLGRHVRRASEVARTNPGRETAVLYIGAVQRFVLILVLFGLGMGKLGLAPLPLLVGFGAAQAGYLISGLRGRAGREAEKLG